MNPLIHVAVAVIKNKKNQYLIAKRLKHVHQGGQWEFPGGKVEIGETTLGALTRELQEEVAIQLQTARPFIQVKHHYEDRSVLLDVWLVTEFSGQAEGCEGQSIAWQPIDALIPEKFPQANWPIMKAIRLPNCYMITQETEDITQLLNTLEANFQKGIRLVQLRIKTMSSTKYRVLANQVLALAQTYQANILTNSDNPRPFDEALFSGVHLSHQSLWTLAHRPLPHHQWVAASCHSAKDLVRACQIGVDFAVLSPVLKTASHPTAVPLGWGKFTSLVKNTSLPIYALGGLQTDQLTTAYRHGAQGIAGISTFMS